MRHMRLVCLAGFSSLLGLVFDSSASANIVADPGFELGGTAWTLNTAVRFPWQIGSGFGVGGAHSGSMDASTGCVGSGCITPDPAAGGAWLFQDLTTTVGTTYSLTFWYAAGNGVQDLQVLFGPTIATDLVNVPGGSSYIQYANTVALMATSNTTRLEFLGRNDPDFNSLDDIAVEAIGQGGVPEPSAYLLLGSGLALLAGWRRLLA